MKAIGLVRHPSWPLEWPLEGDQTQEEVIQEYAQANGYELPSTGWIDISSKATTEEILSNLPKETNTILVHDISRLGRSLPQVLIALKELRKQGLTLISIKDGVRTDDTEKMELFSFLSEVGTALIRETTTEGRNKAHASGKKMGRPKKPIEEKRKKKSGSKLDPKRGAIVKALRKGDSIRKIARSMKVGYGTLHHYIKSRELDVMASQPPQER